MSHYNITKPHGLSNIELLRIINMFFVLIIHADFGALDIPTKKELLFLLHCSHIPWSVRNRCCSLYHILCRQHVKFALPNKTGGRTWVNSLAISNRCLSSVLSMRFTWFWRFPWGCCPLMLKTPGFIVWEWY